MPAVTQPRQMVLSGWGPGRAAAETVQRLSCAVSWHGRWRYRLLRLVPCLLRARLRRFLPPLAAVAVPMLGPVRAVATSSPAVAASPP